MNTCTLKNYETFNPLNSKKETEGQEKPEILTKGILQKIKLIEKAFR